MTQLQSLNRPFNAHQEEEEGSQGLFDFDILHVENGHSPCATCGCCRSSPPSSTTAKCLSPDSDTLILGDQFTHKQKRQNIPQHTLQDSIVTAFPVLRRTISDPTDLASDSVSGSAAKALPNSVVNCGQDTPESRPCVALPPRPPLRRTISDPSRLTSSVDKDGATAHDHESPQFKRLKRMKACMAEMTKWWDMILPENTPQDVSMPEKDENKEGKEQEQENNEDKVIEDNSTKVLKDDSITNGEETVSVERVGECMIVHFKCPCGKGYQILTSRGKCYYMLM